MMLTIATYLIEKSTTITFSEFLEQRVFDPSGITSSSLQPSRAQSKSFSNRIATGYPWNKHNQFYIGFQSLDCNEGQGAESIVTSVNDYIKWTQTVIKWREPITQRYTTDLSSRETSQIQNIRAYFPHLAYFYRYRIGSRVLPWSYHSQPWQGHFRVRHHALLPAWASIQGRFFW